MRSAVMLCLSLGACAADTNDNLAVRESALESSQDCPATCVPVDTSDTVPDKIDEDCDGKIDEDVDATPRNCPHGTNVIEGTRGDDVLHGTRGRDCILGYGGNDTIYGESGDDLLFGGPGDDVIFTGRGKAIVRAGRGDDRVDTSGGTASTVYGEAGADKLKGGKGIDLFFGGPDNDVLDGGGGRDILLGGDCHDRIVGGSSLDLANGGADIDSCEGALSLECERSRRSRVDCQADSDCRPSERCAYNSGFCVPGDATVCSGPSACTPTGSSDDDCDGVDDDCDGTPDDDYTPQPTQCGAGSCSSSGMTACIAGTVQDSCRSGEPLPGNDASCDARDDDCDGRIDEGFVPAATSCGVGACASSGVSACVNGQLSARCTPAPPIHAIDETCDGVDDDCDGTPDDDYQELPSSCGIGACAAAGNTTCVGGRELDSCEPKGALPADDCNGIDDDCDGRVDEAFAPAATSCGAGVCESTGVTRCAAGVLSDSCRVGDPNAEADETCNGRDDDCDGQIDEDFVPYGTSCGWGLCTREGEATCVQGHLSDSCQIECEGQCNDGVEDDGDGLIDCADPDCSDAVGCLQGSFGSPCETDSECSALGQDGFCVTRLPGGYCARLCGTGCPSGTYCLAGGACVVECGSGDHCGRADYVCGVVVLDGVPPEPWCHPTCAFTCPFGRACDAETDVCILD